MHGDLVMIITQELIDIYVTFYGIPFFTFSQISSFEEACEKAINEIKNNKENIEK